MVAASKSESENAEVPWDERHVLLIGADLSFEASASEGEWSKLVDTLGLRKSVPSPESDTWACSFNIAVPEPKDVLLTIFGGMHIVRGSKETAHWLLRLQRIPGRRSTEQEMPAIASSGAPSTLLARLSEHWPAKRTCKVEVRNGYLVDPGHWRSLVPKIQSRQVTTRQGKLQFAPLHVMWTLEGPLDKLESPEISSVLAGEKEPLTITVGGSTELEFSPTILDSADRATWQALSILLEERAGK